MFFWLLRNVVHRLRRDSKLKPKREMDPRLESWIDIVDFIAGQEEEVFVAFQDLKEAGGELISRDVR
jgi:hypothetical protein